MTERYKAPKVYVTLTIEAQFYDEEEEPLTQAEVEDLAHSHANWADWSLLNVGPIRREGR